MRKTKKEHSNLDKSERLKIVSIISKQICS